MQLRDDLLAKLKILPVRIARVRELSSGADCDSRLLGWSFLEALLDCGDGFRNLAIGCSLETIR